jgi:protein-disulfide isomerase
MSSLRTDNEQSLTRKQRREQAREERKAVEQETLARAKRNSRITQLAIVTSVIVVGIVVILISSSGGASKNITPESSEGHKVKGEVTKLLAGIPQNGDALGKPTAPVTLQYYGDLECPVCKAFTLSALPSIISTQVRSGKLRVEYHSLETATREPEVFKAQQVAALSAGRQDRMWNFIETFYHEQGEEDSGYVTEKFIQQIAGQVPGLNLPEWSSDRGQSALVNQVETDAQTASNEHLEGTPAFLLGHSGGAMSRFEPSAVTESGSFEAAVDKLANS